MPPPGVGTAAEAKIGNVPFGVVPHAEAHATKPIASARAMKHDDVLDRALVMNVASVVARDGRSPDVAKRSALEE